MLTFSRFVYSGSCNKSQAVITDCKTDFYVTFRFYINNNDLYMINHIQCMFKSTYVFPYFDDSVEPYSSQA